MLNVFEKMCALMEAADDQLYTVSELVEMLKQIIGVDVEIYLCETS